MSGVVMRFSNVCPIDGYTICLDSDNFEVSVSFALTPKEFNNFCPSSLEVLPFGVNTQLVVVGLGGNDS